MCRTPVSGPKKELDEIQSAFSECWEGSVLVVHKCPWCCYKNKNPSCYSGNTLLVWQPEARKGTKQPAAMFWGLDETQDSNTHPNCNVDTHTQPNTNVKYNMTAI